ncbi:FecR family protein [Myxococcota bacterium]|nr:FecR family protein [Myxococcota bacterium]
MATRDVPPAPAPPVPDPAPEPAADPRVERLLAPLVPGRTLEPDREERLFRRLQAEMQITPTPGARAGGRPWHLVAGGLAAAALAVGLWPASSGTPALPSPPEAGVVVSSPPVAALPAHLTADAPLPGGADVRLHQGEVELVVATADATHLRVLRGGVTSRVPRLGVGQRYLVETPQALVSVHGTQFTVTRATEAATRVEVAEGLVSVDPPGWRPPFFLRPGESAEIGACPETPAEAAQIVDDWRCAADGLRFQADAAGAAGDPLSRDNLRIRAARLLARHAPREAVDLWRLLLAEAPEGIHAEEAAYGLAESLSRSGEKAAARAAAADFRARFPRSPLVSATKQF